MLRERPAQGNADSAQQRAGKSNPWFAVAPHQLAPSWTAHSSARWGTTVLNLPFPGSRFGRGQSCTWEVKQRDSNSPPLATKPSSQHNTGLISNESNELLLTRPINAGFCAEGNQNSKAGVYVILTTTKFQIQSGLYLALETSFFCLGKSYLVNLNIILRILFNQNQINLKWKAPEFPKVYFSSQQNEWPQFFLQKARGFPSTRLSP